MMKSTAAAVKKAVADATSLAPTIVIGRVTAWSSPRATVTIGTTSVPRVRATKETYVNISVGADVLIAVHGSICMIIGTI